LLAVLLALLGFVSAIPAADVGVQLRKLGDVPVDIPPRFDTNLAFSASGMNLLIQCPEPGIPVLWGGRAEPASSSLDLAAGGSLYRLRAVLSLNAELTTVTLTQAPRADGVWVAKDGTILTTETFRRVRRARPELPGALTEIREYVTQDRLRTRYTKSLPKPEVLAEWRSALTPDGVRFEDADGVPLFPDEEARTYDARGGWCRGTEGLFLIKGTTRVEITLPGPRNGVGRISYDPLKHRLLAKAGPKGAIVFDVDDRKRRLLPDFVNHTEISYFLLPGHDALLVQKNRLDEKGNDYIGSQAYLSDLDGNIVSEIRGSLNSLLTACSQHMVVTPVTTKDGKVAFRIFAIEERKK
jgi:hypothetical protein